MKPNIFFQSTIAVVFAVLIFGQTHAQNEKSLLWEITGPGLSQPSYLYGTIHLMCPDQLIVPDKLKVTLEKTQQIYLELDMDSPSLVQEMQASLALPAGKTLRDYCSKEDYMGIDSFFRQHLGSPLEPLINFKPMLAMQMMYIPIIGCQPDSWEARLTALATEQKKEVLGLETIQFQMSVFDSIPLTEQMNWIKIYTGNLPKTTADFQNMLKAYQEQDIEKLVGIVRENPEFKTYATALLDDRNVDWVNRIPAIASQKSTFFAVGAGHLGGPMGVINLLRKNGYMVTAR